MMAEAGVGLMGVFREYDFGFFEDSAGPTGMQKPSG